MDTKLLASSGSFEVSEGGLLQNTVYRRRAAAGDRGWERMKLKWNYPKEQTAPRVSEPDERLKRNRMDAKESFTLPNYAPNWGKGGERDTDLRVSERFLHEVGMIRF